MTEMLERRETAAPSPPPVKERLERRRPHLPRPPAPRIRRWIQWMAAFVVLAVAAVVGVAYLIGSGDDVVAGPTDQPAEHGEFTQAVLVERTALALPIFVGTTPLDLDYPEHWAFTPLATRDGDTIQLARGFVGTNPPNLDPDPAYLEHGEFTLAIIVDRPAPALPIFAGTDPPDLDPDIGG